MFMKAFKIKSNNQLKSSDKRKVKQRVSAQYPKLSDAQFELIFPAKSNIFSIRIITHQDVQVTVFSSDKRPMFFELSEKEIYPTVYSLWLVPDLVPVLTTHPSVLPVLGKGADLMAPGVVRKGDGQKSWGHHRKGEIVGINLTSNKSCCAVGAMARCSEDIYMSGGHGVCVNVKHVFGDKLWAIEPSACLQIPVREAAVNAPKIDDFPALGGDKKQRVEKKEADEAKAMEEMPSPEDISMNNLVIEDREAEAETGEIAPAEEEDTPDAILKRGFMTALKLNGPSLKLPLLVSTFYATLVQPACEPKVDLKQTTYKKLSKFLAEMELERFLTVRQEVKGVEVIVDVNLGHPDLVSFIPVAPAPTPTQTVAPSAQSATHVLNALTKLYVISEVVYPLFAYFQMAKDQCLEEAEVLKCFKDYVMKNKLHNPLNRSQVVPDAVLASILNSAEPVDFKRATTDLLNHMPSKYEMRNVVQSKSGKAPVIQLTVKNCKGNKKVTLVNNLEEYGILINEFAKQCKVGVQASTTIVQSEHVKGNQLLVQGNQIRFVHGLLTGMYKVPAKNITGLELAKKEPKKKK